MRTRLAVFVIVLVAALVACRKSPVAAVEEAGAPPPPMRAWPADAPPSNVCQSHDDCSVVVWDGPQPPDPCCDQRVGYYAMSRAFLTFMADYRKRSCGGVKCPTPPFPGAEPACCASIGRCVARKCVTACEDPTADVPKVSVLDGQCNGYRVRPVESEPCDGDAGAVPKAYAGGASSPGFARLTKCCATLKAHLVTLEYGAPYEMKEWSAACEDSAARMTNGCTPTKLTELRKSLRGKKIPDCQLP